MKKRNTFALIALLALGSQAAVRDEWTFQADSEGTLLADAVNTGADGSTFENGGAGVLEADGQGVLLSTPTATNLWEDGSTLDADITDTNILFLRYDLNYDLSSGSNTVGTTIGISFVDNTGTNIAGLVAAYNPADSGEIPDGSPVGMESISGELALKGTLSAIVKVDAGASTMTCWYDVTGGSNFDESTPDASTTISISSINDLRIRATGDATSAGSGDFVAVENIRVADTWESISGDIPRNLAVNIDVFTGEVNSGSVILTNAGNEAANYTVIFPNPFPASIYTSTETHEDLYPFYSGFNLFSSWIGTQTEEMDIGFSFAPFGVAYTWFSVSQTGTITLKTAGGDTATLKPFETATLSEQSTIHCKKLTNKLIVAWSAGTGREFQVWINADGTVQYLYQFGTWGAGTIGATFDQTQTFSHTPGQSARDGLLLTPTPWVRVSPAAGTLGVQTGQTLTFTADASELQSAQIVSFTATIDWGTTTEDLAVTVNVTGTAAPGITISPDPLEFSGPAGFITHATMTLENTGNIALDYILTYSDFETAGYTVERVTPFAWSAVPETSEYIFTAATLDIQPIAIGFPFTFFGSVYTNLIVGVDGTLTLGGSRVIVPFSASLTTNNYSCIRACSNLEKNQFAITWEGMSQPGGGDNQAFQAVLYRDTGVIRFNYEQMLGEWFSGVIQLDNDIYSAGTVTGTLSNESTTVTTDIVTMHTTYITNAAGFVSGTKTYTTNTVVSYADDANRQSIQFVPGKQQIISATPLSGTIPAGSSVLIDVTGDARALTGGDTNSVVESSTFAFAFTGTTRSLSTLTKNTMVTFTATNSVEGAYPAVALVMAADMWGADEPLVSSVQNADGSRTLSWPAAQDGLSRTYTVEYTTSLTDSWKIVAAVINGTSYLDDDPLRNAEPVIFYRVTVQ